MSKEFIQAKISDADLHTAAKQQKALTYFLTSEVQELYSIDYYQNWVERKYHTNDHFLNWVKLIFKTKNFSAFAKFYRNPNPAAKLVNTRIVEPLSRVFFSEDAYFNYKINNDPVDYPPELEDGFEEALFNTLLFRHNDIIIHDMKDINEPFREFLDIERVVSIEVDRHDIKRLAYSAVTVIDSKTVNGYVYMDAERFAFFDADFEELISEPHDLGVCPATFVCKDVFGRSPIVRKSIFSYMRADLEEYAFLKTLQKMTEPNGAIPISVRLDTEEIDDSGQDKDGEEAEPMSSESIGEQKPDSVVRANAGTVNNTLLQAGTEIKVPAIEKQDGSIDMDVVKDFFHFYYIPVEALEYLNTRLDQLEQDIIISALGDYSEGNEVSMTDKHVQKTFVSKEDKLRGVSNSMSWAREKSDFIMLALAYGRQRVQVDTFYGSDFFWETPEKLYEMFQKSPNQIERKNILTRLAKRRNMFNREKAKKEVILYKLLPYASDTDFNTAKEGGLVDDTTFQLQTRFHYWITLFEAQYGSIVTFWDESNMNDSVKILLINNLLSNLIQTNVS